MRLTDEEQAMLAGEAGEPRRWAIRHQIAVGEFFDAADLIPVSQAHIMADTESLGEAGVAFLETLATAPEAERRVQIPTLTDPRGLDFQTYKRLGQTEAMATLEARTIAALKSFGVLMTDTCINYQTIMPPTRGEHLAMGDTGVVIYSNSVFGARSNFEGGPSALAAALTGRTPRYGYHLDECRRPTRRFRLAAQPRDLSAWGAPGGMAGREVHAGTTLLVATSPEIKHAADRMGLTGRIEAAGAIVAAGICFYQSYAGEMAEANGWKRLLTNSAKLVNIIGGYGYRPTLLSLERCVDSAIAGRVV